MTRVIITGATGFLGGWLSGRMVETGVDVIAITRAPPTNGSFANLSGKLLVLPSEPLGIEVALENLPDVDAVFHFATEYGRDGVPSWRVAQTNVVFSLQLLEWALRHETPAFFNIDTCFTTDYPYLKPYTLSKKQFVAWGRTLTESTSTKFVNLVLQHPFGPGDRPGKFVPWIIEQCLTRDDEIALTSGEQEKDFIYVADVASACELLLNRIDDLGSDACSIDVGRGEAISVRRFVEMIHRLSQTDASLDFGALPQRPGEPARTVANTSFLREMGWTPKFSLAEGIAQAIEVARATITPSKHRADRI